MCAEAGNGSSVACAIGANRGFWYAASRRRLVLLHDAYEDSLRRGSHSLGRVTAWPDGGAAETEDRISRLEVALMLLGPLVLAVLGKVSNDRLYCLAVFLEGAVLAHLGYHAEVVIQPCARAGDFYNVRIGRRVGPLAKEYC